MDSKNCAYFVPASSCLLHPRTTEYELLAKNCCDVNLIHIMFLRIHPFLITEQHSQRFCGNRMLEIVSFFKKTIITAIIFTNAEDIINNDRGKNLRT